MPNTNENCYYLDQDGVRIMAATFYGNLSRKVDKTFLEEKYVTKEEFEAAGIDPELKADIEQLKQSAYKISGSVATVDDLSSIESNVKLGEVYNVDETGMNYIYTVNGWDALGGDYEAIPIRTLKRLFNSMDTTKIQVSTLDDLVNAFENQTNNKEIVFTNDIVVDSTIHLKTSIKTTLNLNEYTLTFIEMGSFLGHPSEITVQNGTINIGTEESRYNKYSSPFDFSDEANDSVIVNLENIYLNIFENVDSQIYLLCGEGVIDYTLNMNSIIYSSNDYVHLYLLGYTSSNVEHKDFNINISNSVFNNLVAMYSASGNYRIENSMFKNDYLIDLKGNCYISNSEFKESDIEISQMVLGTFQGNKTGYINNSTIDGVVELSAGPQENLYYLTITPGSIIGEIFIPESDKPYITVDDQRPPQI